MESYNTIDKVDTDKPFEAFSTSSGSWPTMPANRQPSQNPRPPPPINKSKIQENLQKPIHSIQQYDDL